MWSSTYVGSVLFFQKKSLSLHSPAAFLKFLIFCFSKRRDQSQTLRIPVNGSGEMLDHSEEVSDRLFPISVSGDDPLLKLIALCWSSCFQEYSETMKRRAGDAIEQNKKTCADCGTSKTPLWRGGPAGPKVRAIKPNRVWSFNCLVWSDLIWCVLFGFSYAVAL